MARICIHDMTPPPTGSSVAAFKTAGGASVFADFVLGEVLATIRARYQHAADNALAGRSAGGLFALDVGCLAPGQLSRRRRDGPRHLVQRRRASAAHADAIARSPLGTRVFAGYGGLESDIDAATTEFARRLEAAKSTTVGFQSPVPGRFARACPALGPARRTSLRFAPVSLQRLPLAGLADGADAAAVMAALEQSESLDVAAARSLLSR